MQIVLIKSNRLYKTDFPNNNISTYWIKDFDDNNNVRNLISLDKKGEDWYIFSNDVCYLSANEKQVRQTKLEKNTFYTMKIVDENRSISSALLYIYEENDASFASYAVTENGEYTIGSDPTSNIMLAKNYIAPTHAFLTKTEKGFSIKTNDTRFGIYVNDNKEISKNLESGDMVFILGYSLIVLNDYIIINGDIKINSDKIIRRELPKNEENLLETVEDDNATIYGENDYYSRQPRFVTSIVEEEINIDSPPTKTEPDDTPLFYTIGPMITMTMTSVVSMSTSIVNLSKENASAWSYVPALVVAVAMIASTVLWPSLMRRFTNKKQKKKEEERQKKYTDYLTEKRSKITNIRNNQHQVLIENYPEPRDLQSVILNRKRNLWERQIDSDDFLSVRVGVGTVPLKIHLNYSMEDFTMMEDNLKDELNKLTESAKDIPACPVAISLTERNKLVLIGETQYKEAMLKSIIFQLATYHAYNDLKLVFMLNDDTDEMWGDFKILPHTWSDAKDIRFFASNYDEMSKISFYLEQVFMARKYSDNDGKQVENNYTYRNVRPYYLIIVDNIKKNKNVEIIKKVLEENSNLGFGLIVLNDGIANLPNEINDFLTADGEKSAILKNDLNKNNQQTFKMDDVSDINFGLMCEKLSNIPIKASELSNEFKSSVGFLEMYEVGRVEQLNILDRWENNDIVNSLNVPIGVKSDGELFTLDLHEKFHGPHGLIAGMTGSGKSEFIITYILSMCLNYNPEEVSFVLIDYKGGGLTGAFENKLTGLRLPHLAGTITNLDTAEINRSLSSIQSELKRRQALFNQVKLKLNESTLDIYKYQQLYRQGLIDEPISHLFIISDEFAELKSQQSEFMNELISTARIGRSLGVHLILATQKPSGIVDDQIWSNSKFKVCLKVQEKADSMDVIKRPDAVTLKKAGRFYLQVGYNDYFAMGQAAYAGVKYIPKDRISKVVNRDISFLNNIGDAYRNIETVKIEEGESQGEELSNILKYICATAKSQNLVAKKLWLNKIEPEIFVTDLIKKYQFKASPWELEAIVGEYDDPSNQRQALLTLNFNDNGNTLIYGVSGKEIMLSSIIYSLITSHSSDEMNIYIIDFGSEMFGPFKAAPQIGDVVFINEAEKLNNLFGFITRELEKRKKLFSDYNGSYNIYIKNSGNKLPQILIFINNYEALSETYENYIDIISSLTREGEKYGIIFIITATGVNAVRGKTQQNFNKQLCLQFNDPGDYMSILGSTHGMVPSEIEGRGLFKLDGNIYEFQTAYPYKWDQINTFIKNICSQLSQVVKKEVGKIAILPTHVRLSDISSCVDDLKSVPIGIKKESLEVAEFDFNRNPISIISAQDSMELSNFVRSLCQVIESINNTELFVIDADENIEDQVTFKNYISSNYKEVLEKIEKLSSEDSNINYVFMIYGVQTFIESFESEEARKLKTAFSNLKNSRNVKVIFADSVSNLKTFEYDDFYRNCVQPTNGIWLGSGLTDQYTIKTSTYNKQTRSEIENDFGYLVEKGAAIYVKLLDFYTED